MATFYTQKISTTNKTKVTFAYNDYSSMLLNERVYKSDGTLFGVCTTFNSAVLLTFSGGLKNAITNNDILFTGTNYHILNNVKIPNGVSLKLSSNEFNFDNNNYNLYINSSSSTGDIDIITRY